MESHGQRDRGDRIGTVLTRPRVAFVINGGPGCAMAGRASAFSVRLADQFDIKLLYRESGTVRSIARILMQLAQFQPDCCYVFDLAAAGVVAAGLYKHATGTPFVLDTGDDVVSLGRILGRGPLGMFATRTLEAYALRSASRVVVRGSFHRDLLRKRGLGAVFVPDGVNVEQFAPKTSLPGPHDVEKSLVIGLVGSSVWIPSRSMCYGWELVELVRILKDRLPGSRVTGVLIGDGSGIEILRKKCSEYEISDRIELAGRVPYDELPTRVQMFNICLSTQTDDSIGRVRTTGKLPLYLAAGRFVLASRVGEASKILPAEMLVEFRGSVDPDYPSRLADRVMELVERRTQLEYQPDCVAIAREHFEYDVLAPRVADVLRTVIEDLR